MISSWQDFSINENLQRARRILRDLGIPETDPEFIKLRSLLQRNAGYIGKFTEWLFKDKIPYSRLENLYNQIKSIRLSKPIDQFEKPEDIIDLMIRNDAEATLNQVIGSIPSRTRQKLQEIYCHVCDGKKTVNCKSCIGNDTCEKCDGEGEEECNECDGDGSIRCDECDGDGDLRCKECNGRENINCKECDGEGEKECKECSGDGRISCKLCDGEGEINGITCHQCDGDGDIECEKCDGVGEIKCKECNGEGSNPCTKCDGDGISVCTKCDGDGQIGCKTCNQNGFINCKVCNGTGHEVKGCKTCNEKGKLDCPACKGKESPEWTSLKRFIVLNKDKKSLMIDFFSKKGGRYSHDDDAAELIIKDLKRIFNIKSIPDLKKSIEISNGENAIVVSDNKDTFIIAVNYNGVREYGSSYWCITEDEDTYEDYVKYNKHYGEIEATIQLIVFFKNKTPLLDERSVMGITYDVLKKSIEAAHWEDDRDCVEAAKKLLLESPVPEDSIFDIIKLYDYPISKNDLAKYYPNFLKKKVDKLIEKAIMDYTNYKRSDYRSKSFYKLFDFLFKLVEPNSDDDDDDDDYRYSGSRINELIKATKESFKRYFNGNKEKPKLQNKFYLIECLFIYDLFEYFDLSLITTSEMFRCFNVLDNMDMNDLITSSIDYLSKNFEFKFDEITQGQLSSYLDIIIQIKSIPFSKYYKKVSLYAVDHDSRGIEFLKWVSNNDFEEFSKWEGCWKFLYDYDSIIKFKDKILQLFKSNKIDKKAAEQILQFEDEDDDDIEIAATKVLLPSKISKKYIVDFKRFKS